jgi:hypothetical protein
MSSGAAGLSDWLSGAHPVVRAAAAVIVGGVAFCVWMIVGFLTGVVAMCASAGMGWIDTWFVLLAGVPIWATWTTWRLLEPDADDSAVPGRERFARHLRRSPVRLLRLTPEPMDSADGE